MSINRYKIAYRNPFDLKGSLPTQLHALQFVTFLYAFYRLISREYFFISMYDMEVVRGLFSNPLTFKSIFNLTFLYQFFSVPDVQTVMLLQNMGIMLSILGILGVFPRISGLLLFIFFTHFSGLMNGKNLELDSVYLLNFGLVVLSLSERKSLYSLLSRNVQNEACLKYEWPVVLFLILTTSYYSMAGFNKLIDYGIFWNTDLNLENLSKYCIQNSTVIFTIQSNSKYCSILSIPYLSNLFTWIVFVAEASFIIILWYPGLALFYVVVLSVLHILFYYTAGVSFLGNVFMLIVCLDWNAHIRAYKSLSSPAKRTFE